MKEEIAIGVDVGGSHIVSAAVNLKTKEIIPDTTFTVKINNKEPKDIVLKNWSNAINKSIEKGSISRHANIGFAIPGPFNYKDGVAMYEGDNDKYENLYRVSITDELPKFITAKEVGLRFLNDATSFGVGVATQGKAKACSRIIVITLGTGFGSAFIKDGIPQVNSNDVPEGGCLWDKPFKDSIADDYFSTRWCVERYFELSKIRVKGVKEVATANNENANKVFKEFGANMAEFMLPIIENFKPEIIVMGGNVSKASELFLPAFKEVLESYSQKLEFEMSPLMEDAAILGSARLFEPDFWNKVKDNLPKL